MIRSLLLGATTAVLAALCPAKSFAVSPTGAPETAYSFAFVTIDGAPMPLEDFRGKTLLVVNTASQCGFTSQYAGLQALWHRYRDRGLVVLGVPSNDFGGQEPGTEASIKEFCAVNFDIDFPLTAKAHVRSAPVHPFYRWAGQQVGPTGQPRWNFHKYLIAPDGRLVDWFSTVTPPDADRLRRAIEDNLPAPQG